MSNPSSRSFTFVYFDNHRLNYQKYGSVASTIYTYDNPGRATNLTTRQPANVYCRFAAMSYNALDDWLGMQTAVYSAPTGLPANLLSYYSGNVNYSYDLSGTAQTKEQLVQETSPTRAGGYTNNFAYDNAGNPTTFANVSGIAYNTVV